MITLFKKTTLLILALLTLSGLSLPYSLTMAQAADNPFSDLEEISLKNSAQLQQIATMDGVKSGYSVSHDDQEVAVAYPDGVRIYELGDFANPILLLPVQDAFEVYAPVFSPDGKQLTITFIPNGDTKSITQVWNLANKKIEQSFSTLYYSLDTDGAHFSPNGRYLLGSARAYRPGIPDDQQPNEGFGEFYVWDIVTGETICEPEECASRYGLSDLSFTPDSQEVMWSGPDFNLNHDFEIYWNFVYLGEGTSKNNLSSFTSKYPEEGGPFSTSVGQLIFNPRGDLLVSLGSHYIDEPKTQFWDVKTGEEIKISFDDRLVFLRFFDDQIALVWDSTNETINLWDIHSNQFSVLFKNVPDQYWRFSFTNTKKLIATWENNQLKFWGVPKA